MIFGISGNLCSGKASLAAYLEKDFNFKTINLYQLFKEESKFEGTDLQLV